MPWHKRPGGTYLRIPFDYDNTTWDVVRCEALRLWSEKIKMGEIWRTSPGNHRLVFIADGMTLDEALDLIDRAGCDPDYKHWVRKHRDLSERISAKDGDPPVLLETINPKAFFGKFCGRT